MLKIRQLLHKPKVCYLALFGLCALGLSLTACGDGAVRQIEVPETALTEEVPDTSRQKDPAAFEAAVASRIKQGDTLAIDHKKLEALLPDKIEGYSLDINKASTFETKTYTFSEATRVFYNGEENYIEFIAGDYVDDPDFFKVNLQRYNLAQGVEIDGIREAKRVVEGMVPAKVSDYFTWSLFNRDRGVARVYLGVNYRYFVTIEATGQTDFLDLNDVKDWLHWSAVLN